MSDVTIAHENEYARLEREPYVWLRNQNGTIKVRESDVDRFLSNGWDRVPVRSADR